MTKQLQDIAASVRARLLRVAAERGEDYQSVLNRYASERLLYRLSRSQHSNHFVLKGATLFTIWTQRPHRATADVDLLGFGEPSAAGLISKFADILAVQVDEDGVAFDAATMRVAAIREDNLYGGIRLTVRAAIGSAEARVQFDVGFGDAVTPAPSVMEMPSLLNMPAPLLRAYPRETVVAEKLEALVKLGLANSRMKDFYDLQVLAAQFDFDGNLLAQAVRATFDRRLTSLPTETPVGLSSALFDDADKQRQWTAFVRKSNAREAASLVDTCKMIECFVMPAIEAARHAQPWHSRWPAGGPWHATSM